MEVSDATPCPSAAPRCAAPASRWNGPATLTRIRACNGPPPPLWNVSHLPELIQSQLPWLSPPWSVPAAAAVVALSAMALAFGAHWTVEASVQIAERLRISPQVIGLTLVAMGTSAPEFAVSLSAALGEGSSIAISNVVGSNIFNLAFILGGVALFRPLATGPAVVWRDGTVLVLSSLAVWLLFGIDLGVERSNGALLLLCLASYLALLFGTTRSRRPADPVSRGVAPPGRGVMVTLQMLGGVLLIAASAELLVEAASSIAATLGLSEWVIGITIVAAGTSLPEFTISLIAAVRGHYGLSLGNIIGSDIFNVLGVLGLTALIQPVPIGPEASGSLLALLGMVALTVVFMRTGWRLTQWEGAILIALGLLRWAFDFGA
jgi:cation:H+ antiporter